jgi:hypothetical protein
VGASEGKRSLLFDGATLRWLGQLSGLGRVCLIEIGVNVIYLM